MSSHLLIVGVSTRAAAESAARAGFDVTAIDAFADLDQHPSVRARSLRGGFSADAAARAARSVTCDAVAYLSNFENHPSAVSELARGRALWGNRPNVLRRVRDPIAVARALAKRQLPTPAVYVEPVTRNPQSLIPDREWLLKPLASGGGHRVRAWRAGTRIPRNSYLQELVEGTPGSVVFVAAGGRAVALGITRQLIGDDAFGVSGYRYCGNILVAPEDHELVDAACALAAAVTAEFDLVGINGIDFIARGRVPWPIEINPRWCASMELVERAHGVSVFGAHAAACTAGTLPDFDLKSARRSASAVGKAVVFARRRVRVGDTRAWLPADLDDQHATIRDVPQPGQTIQAGRPVCTVFAEERDDAACRAALGRRAELVYADLAAWERNARPRVDPGSLGC